MVTPRPAFGLPISFKRPHFEQRKVLRSDFYCLHIALFLFLKKQNCLWVQQRLAPDAGRLEVHEHVPPLLQHPAAELEVDVISWKIGFYFGLNVNPTFIITD